MKPLQSLKREIRILGLDACNPKVTIGAILRGGFYLDGVLTFSEKISSTQLAREITETKYFPELRLIMVHGPNRNLNSPMMQRITRLPLVRVPLVANGMAKGARNSRSRLQDQRNLWGINLTTARKILELTMTTGRLPEPVRIAHLLAKLQVFGRHLQDKR